MPTPRFIPTDEQRHAVTVLSANGVSQDAIADALGFTDDTLRRYFRAELDHGHTRIKARIGAALVTAGLNGNVAAMKFWLASRCPEWRIAKEQLGDTEPDNEVVHFYLPPNHRDEPERIEGEARRPAA